MLILICVFFQAHHCGLIENHSGESLKVDFANKYIGGGALNRGCVQVTVYIAIIIFFSLGLAILLLLSDENVKFDSGNIYHLGKRA